MIVCHTDGDLLLITQADHAALAAQITEAWTSDQFPQRVTRSRVQEATRLHDIGWRCEDATPGIDSSDGMPYDVFNAPLAKRQGAWPRAVEELASGDPYIAALVAQHALTVYRRFADAPEWMAFFQDMERRRDELLAMEHRFADDAFLRDYAIVGLGDQLSLTFCYGWAGPTSMKGYQVNLRPGTPPGTQDIVDGGVLEIAPDPFNGARIPLTLPARRIARRRYQSEADLHSTISSAAVVQLAGVACGV